MKLKKSSKTHFFKFISTFSKIKDFLQMGQECGFHDEYKPSFWFSILFKHTVIAIFETHNFSSKLEI